MTHRHVCSCGDWRLCKERDCLPGTFEQCPSCELQQEQELARERAYRTLIAQRQLNHSTHRQEPTRHEHQ
jgi:hypothetical protein